MTPPDAGSSPSKQSMRGILPRSFEAPLLFAIFLDLVGFGMMFPDVQLRAQEYGAPGWLIGVILASYYPVQMVASPVWGRLSDRVGRKPVLLICGGISAGSMIIYALGGSVWAMLLSRMAAGLGAANVVTAQAYIADSTSEIERAGALGRMSAAVSLGLVAGPVIGGALASFGGNFLLGMVAAAASGLGTLWIFLTVPHRKPVERVGVTTHLPPFSHLLQERLLLRLFIVASVGWLALGCLEGTFGRLIQHNLGYGRMEFGLLLSLEAGVAFIQGILYPAAAARFSPGTLLRASYVLEAVGLAAMPFATGLGWLILFCSMFGIGLGAAGPTINAAASDLTPPSRQGELFGLLQSSRALGFLMGPILGGMLFDWKAAAPYLAAGCVMALASLFVQRGFSKQISAGGV
jgi:DHA1 family multidrug resistance protein-like MFS transporter